MTTDNHEQAEALGAEEIADVMVWLDSSVRLPFTHQFTVRLAATLRAQAERLAALEAERDAALDQVGVAHHRAAQARQDAARLRAGLAARWRTDEGFCHLCNDYEAGGMGYGKDSPHDPDCPVNLLSPAPAAGEPARRAAGFIGPDGRGVATGAQWEPAAGEPLCRDHHCPSCRAMHHDRFHDEGHPPCPNCGKSSDIQPAPLPAEALLTDEEVWRAVDMDEYADEGTQASDIMDIGGLSGHDLRNLADAAARKAWEARKRDP